MRNEFGTREAQSVCTNFTSEGTTFGGRRAGWDGWDVVVCRIGIGICERDVEKLSFHYLV